jgi:hypothetical protein
MILGASGLAMLSFVLFKRRERMMLAVPSKSVAIQAPAPTTSPQDTGTSSLPPYPEVRRSVISYVAGRESGRKLNPGATNLNTDGVGLSFGIVQWAQKAGSLGKLLKAMQAKDPSTFARIFGPASEELIAVTNSTDLNRRMAPVGGVVLWQEPWVSRFKQAATHQPFVDVQWDMASTGGHMQGAEQIARVLNTKTPRAMVLFFDRTNHQGPGYPVQWAEEIAAKYQGQKPPYPQILVEFRDKIANRFRSSTPREGTWKQVGNEWHKFTPNGRIDTYAQIIRRTDEILNDTTLSDAEIVDFPI